MALVVLVVLGDLRLTLLENFDFKTTLTWPLLSEVLVQFLDGFVLEVFDLNLDFMTIVDFLGQKPAQCLQ